MLVGEKDDGNYSTVVHTQIKKMKQKLCVWGEIKYNPKDTTAIILAHKSIYIFILKSHHFWFINCILDFHDFAFSNPFLLPLKSSNAYWISCLLFITKGPYCCTGSCSGLPAKNINEHSASRVATRIVSASSSNSSRTACLDFTSRAFSPKKACPEYTNISPLKPAGSFY